jgi:hypothetical protein
MGQVLPEPLFPMRLDLSPPRCPSDAGVPSCRSPLRASRAFLHALKCRQLCQSTCGMWETRENADGENRPSDRQNTAGHRHAEGPGSLANIEWETEAVRARQGEGVASPCAQAMRSSSRRESREATGRNPCRGKNREESRWVTRQAVMP